MRADLETLLRESLTARGATGLVNTEIPCGCGLDNLMPCDEPSDTCEAAYAVMCDGTNCEQGCEARPYPNRPDFETVCFVAMGVLDDEA